MYATIALKPETKRRLEKLRKERKCRSMDELMRLAAHELELQALAERLRQQAKGWREAAKDERFREFEEALDGLDKTVAVIRRNAAKNARARQRRLR